MTVKVLESMILGSPKTDHILSCRLGRQRLHAYWSPVPAVVAHNEHLVIPLWP